MKLAPFPNPEPQGSLTAGPDPGPAQPQPPPAAKPQPAAEAAPAPPRLVSLDALRGFAMFWILGASMFARAFHEMPGGAARFFEDQLTHAKWEGFHFEDLIFPLFVFVAGVSIVLTLPRKVERDGRARTARRVALRALALYLFGLWVYGGVSHGWGGIRWVGVLQRIAFAYLGASLLFLWLKPRGLIATLVAILLGYWALLAWVPVPGVGAGHFAEGQNLPNYLDRMYLPGKRWDVDHDPEGLLSNLPAIATCLFGVLAGLWLGPRADMRKAVGLMVAGSVLLAVGTIWGWEFPVIKKLWTSSFVLVAAGWSAFLLGLFFLVIDVWKVRRWAAPLVWVGMNSITLYLLENAVSSSSLAARVAGGDVSKGLDTYLAPGVGGLCLALVATTWSLGLAWFLHHRRIFLRV